VHGRRSDKQVHVHDGRWCNSGLRELQEDVKKKAMNGTRVKGSLQKVRARMLARILSIYFYLDLCITP
jgi:hypothetical protein